MGKRDEYPKDKGSYLFGGTHNSAGASGSGGPFLSETNQNLNYYIQQLNEDPGYRRETRRTTIIK